MKYNRKIVYSGSLFYSCLLSWSFILVYFFYKKNWTNTVTRKGFVIFSFLIFVEAPARQSILMCLFFLVQLYYISLVFSRFLRNTYRWILINCIKCLFYVIESHEYILKFIFSFIFVLVFSAWIGYLVSISCLNPNRSLLSSSSIFSLFCISYGDYIL